jgi:DNA-binding transcriptional LysR family regulator
VAINLDELIDPRAVSTFRVVVQAGGFRKAAALLGLTQPAVSAAVRRLEEELGLQLFVADGRRKVPTREGRELAALAGRALEDWAGLEDRVREALTGAPSGRLRVGAGESSLLYLLPTVIGHYRRDHPRVELALWTQPYEECVQLLQDGALDLAVRSLSRATPGITAAPLRKVRRVFVTARSGGPKLGKRPTIAELAELPFVLPHRRSTTRMALEGAMAAEGRACQVALEAGGWEAVKLYVAQGLGVGLVPEIVVGPADRRRLATTPAGHLFRDESYGVLRAAGRPLSKAAEAMVEILQAVRHLESKA